MFLLNRKGLIALYGNVENVKGNTVFIKGTVELPVSKVREERTCRVSFEKGLGNYKLKKGDRVIVSAKPSMSVLSLLNDKAETNERVYDLKGYYLRYSGAFRFKQYKDEAEQNIFSGKIKNIEKTAKGWSIITLSVYMSGDYRNVYLVSFTNKPVTDDSIFVTGPAVKGISGTREYYPVQSIS